MSLSREAPEVYDEAMQNLNEGFEKQSSLMIPPKIQSSIERANIASRINDRLLEEYSALETHVLLKQAADIFATAIDFNKEKAVRATTEKETIIFGAKVETKHIRDWDYGDDAMLMKLDEQKKEIAKQIKERQQYLQLLNKQHQVGVDPETGEEIQPAKLVKDGLQISITLPK